jgi:hypothetical protein
MVIVCVPQGGGGASSWALLSSAGTVVVSGELAPGGARRLVTSGACSGGTVCADALPARANMNTSARAALQRRERLKPGSSESYGNSASLAKPAVLSNKAGGRRHAINSK